MSMIKRLSIPLLMVLLLMGCSDTEKPATEGLEDESTAPAEVEPEEETETPVTEPEPETGSSPAELATYGTAMSTILAETSRSLDEFGEINDEAAVDPTLLFSDTWIAEMDDCLALLDQRLEDIRSITPPVEFIEAHNTILMGVEEYQFVVDNYSQAIQNLDPDMIEECTVHLQNGSQYMKDAQGMVADVNASL